ncbi:aspartate kinase [Chishuiella changwenlii]|uniref:Aspartate kinase n=1 Tax=Chishuiella changwenlii TaxID=1434701 RepID=A0A1M7A1M8_9FLAO|nr:bifunctional aspartate kinase/homoserine dehydrogenase I [Chishuiella changwenlii]GGE91884.1 bifunctional aspartate kinase/homoserine dehydrogenase I [Chishuiella changwenlii]SHL36651.1 aspartate kinase [Chishuiella changwenlii]
MKILKFGGTSVGSVNSLKAVVEIVKKEKEQNNPIIMVVSAVHGMTNLLTKMAKDASLGELDTNDLDLFQEKHFEIIRASIDVKNQNPIITKLKLLMNELEELLHGIAALKELSAQSKDLIISFGERCSTLMISKILEQSISNVQPIDASQYILTDNHFGQAQVNEEVTFSNIRKLVEENSDKLLVVTGFIAANKDGRLTTLGRGGSDYTAALIGAALHAEEIQIWTDVDGMMTADPRLVKKAFSLENLSYTEAMELSYFGAKVIYPPTMTPAFKLNIPIVIKNTFNPNFPGTKIQLESSVTKFPIKGISSVNEISLINIKGSDLVGKLGFSGRLFSLLAQHHINIVLITQSSSEHSITLAIHHNDLEDAKHLIENEFSLEIQAKRLEPVEVEQNLAIIAIVGENMKRTTGVSGKLFYALGRNGINVRAIAQGSSEYNISVVINEKDLSKALNAVHDAFFNHLNKTIHVFNVGVGNIGSTFLNQLEKQKDFLAENNDIEIKLVGLANSKKMVFDENGIDLSNWKQALKQTDRVVDLNDFISTMKCFNLPNCVFIDNTASSVLPSFYKQIFQHSISIVTCNKIANSSSYKDYFELKQTARQHGAKFMYETNVGAGLPIVNVLKDLQMSGDKIVKIEAILSGTISYIFNHFKGENSFGNVVKEAQELGYTEPDPRDDLSGVDFMRKMLILARDAGHHVEAEDVEIASILPQKCLEAESVEDFYKSLQEEDAYFEEIKQRAEKEQKVIRYIGILENGKISISLDLVNDQHPFYSLSGSDNIILFTTERYKERPLVVKGPGAGAEVTAAGVFADLVNVSSIK